MRLSAIARLITVCLLLGAAGTAAYACGGDDDNDDGVTVLSPGPDPVADPEAGESPEPGVVQSPEAGATQVNVTLREFEVAPQTASAPAGKVYFLVQNAGPEDPHEFVIVRSDKAPNDLPVEDGKVSEDDVDIIDEIEPFTPNSTASITVDLQPGSYVLICNITEKEADGSTESHYQNGMAAAFKVE
jgi:uncharacterized cupredoxin-like copper-binding protein